METWKHIRLSEEEEAKIVHIVDPEDDTSTGHDHAQQYLVCKLWTEDNFNVRAFKSTMLNLWKTRNGMEIMDLDKNLFSIRLYSTRDRDLILKGSPWTFDKHVLIIEPLPPSSQPSEIDLHECTFWVGVYDLPIGFRSETVAKNLGANIGSFMDWDNTDEA
ncbi:hypothetical protein SESBI_36560 [Sesbania bispinosa]|nr:hypothetical protein SESBI_36560 [Sesbania bispinosa]